MDLHAIIHSLSRLGSFMQQFQFPIKNVENSSLNKLFYLRFEAAISAAKIHNGWFDEFQVRKSIFALSKWLKVEILTPWTSDCIKPNNPKKIALIMAGNIPLVGFHDFICSLVSGHSVLVKLSSNDKQLLPLISEILIHLNPSFQDKIEFTESRMKDFDAVIATGSDNTARYFDYYFGKYPNIIRKNRNSIAVLSLYETKESLSLLAEDIFSYYGLGCRNVSKIYIPRGFNFDLLFEAFASRKQVMINKKYANNLEYYRALFLMGGNKMLDNGFLLLREEVSIPSPISMLHYEFYESIKHVEENIDQFKIQIQCVVSDLNIQGSLPFGHTQTPFIDDYPDGIDTLAFLRNL